MIEADKALFLLINSWHALWVNPIMKILSGQAVWIPLIAYSLWAAFKKFDRRHFGFFILFLAMTLVVSDVTSSYILKNFFNRLRPCRELDLKPLIYQFGQKCGGKFGFVSSHAANSLALVIFTVRTLKIKGMNFFWVLPLLVSYSRIYLGSHYPGDVLGGFVVGSFAGLSFVWLFKELAEKESSPSEFSHS